MMPTKKLVTSREEVWFRLRMIENHKMPVLARKILVNHILKDASTDQRYNTVGGREVLFVHVPKTGGTSLANALGLPSGHVPVSRYFARDEARFAASFSFAFVRNPWDRLFSAYNYLKASIGLNTSRDVRWAEQNLDDYADFEAFVLSLKDNRTWHRIRRWPHFRTRTDWLCIPGCTAVEVDFVGRFERLAEDFARLATFLDLEPMLTHERKPQSYEDKSFTPEMMDVIQHRYRSDFDILNYDRPV